MPPDLDAEAAVHDLFMTPAGRMDPYPHYRRLREAAPVHRSTSLGLWLLSRYDDCAAALRDPRFGKDYARQTEGRIGPDWRRHPSLTAGEHSMLNVDGPEHTRLRRLVVKAFNRRSVDGLRPTIERMVAALLDPVAEAGGGEILEAVAFPLPVGVIGEMLGVPEADRAQFRGLVRDLTGIFEMRPTAAQLEAADAAQLAIRRYFVGLIEQKRRRPADDLLSRLVTAEDGGDRLTDDELATLASLLFGAGFETTTNLIGNGLLALLERADQFAALRADPALLPALPDELLRFDGTAQMAVRVTGAAVDVGGTTIPAGETVFMLLGAGNHDPARFADPDRLDVTRTGVDPLSFGGGIHYCLGAALARAEIEITFRTFLERFEAIALSGGRPRFRDRLTLRGLETLEVTCRPAPGASRRPAKGVVPAAIAPEPRPSPHGLSEGAVLGLRPRGGVGGADAGWRDALRARVESGTAGDTAPQPQTGKGLLATVVLLARTGLFRRCTAAELEELAATAYPMGFEPGDVLCPEGGEALECYAIAEGEATVSIGGRVVATVSEDDVVGERGPLEGRTRTATVTAASHMITYAISRQRLLALAARSPQAAEGMYDYLRRRYPE